MQRSKIEVYLHMVWATHEQEHWLNPQIERAVHRSIAQESTRLKCVPLALNGMPDHVHFVVQLHSTIAIARLAQAIKGVSSKMVNSELGFEGAFNWQDNYAAFSVGGELEVVLGYVRNQKKHHAGRDLWPEWEETCKFLDMEDEDRD